MWRHTLALAAAFAAGSASAALAQPADPSTQAADDRMEWWREARFGMFIHWGLYAVPAGEWEGQTNHAEWIRTTAQIPLETYDQFREQFNPVGFDADAWAQMAADAGMKYVVITTKHHDGFCLFDSQLTDFDIMSTPFKRDIMAELSAACAERGLRMCWYHSIMDWRHPDYLPRRDWEEAARPAAGADMNRYVQYLFGQVTELLTNYGDIGVMWFDGEWEPTWTHERGRALHEHCRTLQPDVIINNRVDKGRGGMAGMSAEGYLGDFGTPEQEIPATGIPGVDWETCMTMNDHWGFNAHDSNFKSTQDLVRKLCDIASKGGNFLLNVGPKADGTFPQESIDRLREIGAWMEVNSEAIYGTTASPFDDLGWGRCTLKPRPGGSTLYLHVFDWPSSGVLSLEGLGSAAASARLLGDIEREIAIEQRDGVVRLQVGAEPPHPLCPVLAVQIEGRPVVYLAPTIHAASAVLVNPLAITIVAGSPELETRYTLDGTEPSASSPLARGPITIEESCTLTARNFHRGEPVSAAVRRRFERVAPRPAAGPEAAAPGLALEEFEGDWSWLPDFDSLSPGNTRIAPAPALPLGYRREHVALRYTGLLRIPADDVYVFRLTSDDGSRLSIGGEVVVNNDGLHASETRAGTAPLAAGWHRITIDWFNKTGGAALALEMAPVGEAPRPIPPDALTHN